MTAYWLHVFHALMWGFAHVRGNHALYHYYLRHHAVGFLRAGYTSGSGHSPADVWWFVTHGRNPVDW